MSLVLHTQEYSPFINRPEGEGLLEADYKLEEHVTEAQKPIGVLWTAKLKPAPEFSDWFELCQTSLHLRGRYRPNRGYVYDDSNISYLGIYTEADLSKLEPFMRDGALDHHSIAREYDGFYLGKDMLKHPLFLTERDGWDVESQAIYNPRKLSFIATILLKDETGTTADQVDELLATAL